MPFTPPKDFPELSTIITSLNNAKLSITNPALYQTIRDLITKIQEANNVARERIEALNLRADNLNDAIVDPASTVFGPVVRSVPNFARGFTTPNAGIIDNLDFGNTSLIRLTNPVDVTVTGLKAGVMGQKVTIFSLGPGNVFLAHNGLGSLATNRFINFDTSISLQLVAGVGVAQYQYDSITGRWRMIAHHQG